MKFFGVWHMKTIAFWGRNIRARWFSPLLALSALPAVAPAADPGVIRLGQAINAYNVRDYSSVVEHLRGVQIPRLSDYVAYHLASSELQTGDIDGAVRDLAVYRAKPIASSPLAGKISLLNARALLDQHQPASTSRALNILQSDYKLLPQPDGDFALGLAYEAQGEKLQAALSYSKVYYAYPNTDLAAQSWTAMDRLRTVLGKDFPSAPPRQQLDRCQRWLDAREFYKARVEYTALAGSLPEPDRDEARVGVGAAEFLGGDANSAFRYLKDLKVAKSDADARRLYYLTEAARKTGDDTEMMNAVKQLGEHYPDSAWRLKALVSAGNRYVVTNDRDKYDPLFKAASDAFPADSSTAYCHWKVAWDAYLAGKPERIDLMREQIERYPADSRASTALYFLGRAQEKSGKYGEARAYYDRLSSQYPHYFYAVLARERLKEAKMEAAKPDEALATWLDGVEWPEHRDFSSSEPNAATKLRIERARLLMTAGLPDVADAELRFGAKTDNEQPHLLAMELARSMPSPFHALRIMKSFMGDYLSIPFDSAPLKFWQMLFPLPYRDDVVRNAKSRNLDPYSVAALIRQETEFNPAARSPANAYGLMQLVLPTGRMVGRQTGIRVSSARTLLDPGINIQLGTQYLRSQLNNWNGDWFQTLAAYNAGPSRVRQWLTWSDYREPAEFVESIPFNETREYVQAVMRNADMYRTLYGEKHAAMPEVRDVADVPPVNLASLPLAARTPGGGRKPTTVAHRTVTAKRRVAASRKRVASSKTALKPARKSAVAKHAPAKKKERAAAD
ncbi:MAG TPA: transglycosylase SLT domain-containing protein [Bryobacteraceae bacterium]|nr:transglycosylase SLT domain-containing protein [Bryobacteraceae bacterium]